MYYNSVDYGEGKKGKEEAEIDNDRNELMQLLRPQRNMSNVPSKGEQKLWRLPSADETNGLDYTHGQEGNRIHCYHRTMRLTPLMGSENCRDDIEEKTTCGSPNADLAKSPLDVLGFGFRRLWGHFACLQRISCSFLVH